MSQRLHVGKTTEEFYDCVIENEIGAREKLLSEWIYAGPWKIRIGDLELWKNIEPVVADLFEEIGEEYPDIVWTFHRGDRTIQHPTQDEFSAWLRDVARFQNIKL